MFSGPCCARCAVRERECNMAARKVEIPEEIFIELEELLPKLDMSSVDECVAFILKSLLSGEFDDEEVVRRAMLRLTLHKCGSQRYAGILNHVDQTSLPTDGVVQPDTVPPEAGLW